MKCEIKKADCESYIGEVVSEKIDLTFLDPPFNQNKEYLSHNDDMSSSEYWSWMRRICGLVYKHTSKGGAIYFMQREKNTNSVLDSLKSTGWEFQNLIIWRKKTSAVPGAKRFGKHYQIIAFFTKGKSPRVFNRLRIDPPLLQNQKHIRQNGIYITDVWDDIRELTSGYFAGGEPLRFKNGERVHRQQSPIKLLTRIILSSSNVGDLVFDPFAGTGTTLIVANQLKRRSLGIEVDQTNVNFIKDRIKEEREVDNIFKFRNEYINTKNLKNIWPFDEEFEKTGFTLQEHLFKKNVKHTNLC